MDNSFHADIVRATRCGSPYMEKLTRLRISTQKKIIIVVTEKGKTMSRYVDSGYEDLAYELDKFLESHKPSELLRLVRDAVEWWEEKDDE